MPHGIYFYIAQSAGLGKRKLKIPPPQDHQEIPALIADYSSGTEGTRALREPASLRYWRRTSAKRGQEAVDALRIPSDAESAFALGALSGFAIDN